MGDTLILGRTRGGREWIPTFVVALDQSLCIGCGRCYKTCPRDVFALVDRGGEDDEDEDDGTAKVMSLADQLDCIGCTACANVCPKSCLTHAALDAGD